jgi:transcriptional regulator with XRE-family HTH domain
MPKLPHYLRSERRRAGLSQKDLAILMGLRTVSQISRYEQQHRCPPLRVALTYEVIFGKPVSQIFAGVLVGIENTIRSRAATLAAHARHTAPRHKSREALIARLLAA